MPLITRARSKARSVRTGRFHAELSLAYRLPNTDKRRSGGVLPPDLLENTSAVPAFVVLEVDKKFPGERSRETRCSHEKTATKKKRRSQSYVSRRIVALAVTALC